ncbi:hypothetical protein GBA52_022319 [Prunus armeniaca]|nr:hypothetical protein GBA52_022319 [Prunus armeniaca]
MEINKETTRLRFAFFQTKEEGNAAFHGCDHGRYLWMKGQNSHFHQQSNRVAPPRKPGHHFHGLVLQKL